MIAYKDLPITIRFYSTDTVVVFLYVYHRFWSTQRLLAYREGIKEAAWLLLGRAHDDHIRLSID